MEKTDKTKEIKQDVNLWLPTSKKEMEARGWEQADVILFTGDAYIDHPSFGAAVIGRLLEKLGLKVAIVPQPNWRDDLRDFKKLGEPRLFFGVTSGCMDSMVNHYTANIRLRSDDAYSIGGKAGFRPDYAVTVYSQVVKKCFPDIPVIIGGIEASLRRFSHYDYWSDTVKSSVLVDSKADMLVYGMGEKPITEIVRLMKKGVPLQNLHNIPQTAFLVENENIIPVKNWETIELHDHEIVISDKEKYAQNFKFIEEESNKMNAARLIQKNGAYTIVVNPSYPVISEKEMDEIYDLPYTRLPHPRYAGKGVIPAYEMIRHSVNIHRGCFGGCTFCTISAHQGKFIASRSEKSILKEIDNVVNMPDFTGHITDLGGPSANMYKMQGENLEICEKCKRPSCIFPEVCKNLQTDHSYLINLYKKVRQIKGIKKVTIGSGIRYDLFLNDKKPHPSHDEYLNELILHHVSGRLKVAPEHTSPQVLKLMRKPGFDLYRRFFSTFKLVNQKNGKNQQLIPYFISSHPGSTIADMAELAIEAKNMNYQPEQIQDFTPTPMTLATVMYHTGINPFTGEKVFVAKNQNEKRAQRSFFFWYKKENQAEIKNLLLKINRKDLIQKLFK